MMQLTVITMWLSVQQIILFWRSKCYWITFPVTRTFDQSLLVGNPVSIMFHKHHPQTDGVFLRLLQRERCCKSFLCVSVWLSYELKTKLSEAIATENVLLQSEMWQCHPSQCAAHSAMQSAATADRVSTVLLFGRWGLKLDLRLLTAQQQHMMVLVMVDQGHNVHESLQAKDNVLVIAVLWKVYCQYCSCL